MSDETEALAGALLDTCRLRGVRLATAESLTAGLISATICAIAGASDVVDRGWVVYTYAAKTAMLGVDAALLAREGAVNEAVARAMVEGALREGAPDVSLAIAVTGVAGPGESEGRPAGRVHLAAAMRGGEVMHVQMDYGAIGRNAVRGATVRDALRLALKVLG